MSASTISVRTYAEHRNRAQLAPDSMKKLGMVLRDGKPFVPGSDFAGIIHSAGTNSRWTVGQEVHGMKMNMDGQ